jgi:DNA-binding NarL/FixJ family response regulator
VSGESSSDLNKIASLLALIVTKDQPKGVAALTLSACGFSNKEIAALTGSQENSVRAMISQARRKQGDNG